MDLTDGTGSVVDRVSYDPFGNVTSESTPSNGDASKYAGMRLDPTTGMSYDVARYYDAAIGSFMGQDPTGFAAGDPNFYRYVGNSPTNATDPTGLEEGGAPGSQPASWLGAPPDYITPLAIPPERLTRQQQMEQSIFNMQATINNGYVDAWHVADTAVSSLRQGGQDLGDGFWNRVSGLANLGHRLGTTTVEQRMAEATDAAITSARDDASVGVQIDPGKLTAHWADTFVNGAPGAKPFKDDYDHQGLYFQDDSVTHFIRKEVGGECAMFLATCGLEELAAPRFALAVRGVAATERAGVEVADSLPEGARLLLGKPHVTANPSLAEESQLLRELPGDRLPTAQWHEGLGLEPDVAPRGVQANKAAGDAWERELLNNELPKTQGQIQPQISIKSNGPSGMKVRLDAVGTDTTTGSVKLTDGKASATAPLTPNQKIVYPELETNGGVVIGKGKPPYVGGTQIPPTKVDVIRKP
jgi:RHS repeat-associated protein